MVGSWNMKNDVWWSAVTHYTKTEIKTIRMDFWFSQNSCVCTVGGFVGLVGVELKVITNFTVCKREKL